MNYLIHLNWYKPMEYVKSSWLRNNWNITFLSTISHCGALNPKKIYKSSLYSSNLPEPKKKVACMEILLYCPS